MKARRIPTRDEIEGEIEMLVDTMNDESWDYIPKNEQHGIADRILTLQTEYKARYGNGKAYIPKKYGDTNT